MAKWSPVMITVVVLLVLCIVGVIIVGALFPTIESKEGPRGPDGKTGPIGKAAAPVIGALVQQSASVHVDSVQVIQYGHAVTLNVLATITTTLLSGTSYILGVLSGVSLPSVSTVGTLFRVQSSQMAASLLSPHDGAIVIGPLSQNWPAGNQLALSLMYIVAA